MAGPNSAAFSTIDQSVDRIEQLGQDGVHKIGVFSDWTATFAAIDTLTREIVEERVKMIDDKRIPELVKEIRTRRDKLSLSSGIKDKIVSISQQILAFGAAGIALSVGFVDKVRFFSPTIQKSLAIVGIFYAELILLSLLVLIWYLLQARFRYPYLYFDKIGNAWPFFYYATVTQVPRSPVQFSKSRYLASVSYAKDFVQFADKILSETPKETLRVELQQYFLLMVYQGYAHQFSLRLANIFMYGFTGALTTAIVFFGMLGWGRL